VDLSSPSKGHSGARQALDTIRAIEDPLEQLEAFQAALDKELGEWRLALRSILGAVAGKDLGRNDRSTLLQRQKAFANQLNWIMDRTGVSLCVAGEPEISFRLIATPQKSGVGSFQFLDAAGRKRLGSITIPNKARLKLRKVLDL
jgi:hypothetical protein